MLTILFVDDEPNILRGIRRATRGMRDSWDMHFAESGSEALTFLSANSVDVVVSDMRMPTMDGAELLQTVRSESPTTARIILSGYAEEEAVFRSTRVAHQFLAKPCDVEELKRTIEQIQLATDGVEPESIKALIGQLEQLPALGDIYTELMAAMERDTATNETLARIVSKDVALTAEILRLVNSAFFGLTREMESVGQAIGYLGIDVVRAMVAGHSLFGNDVPVLDVNTIARRSQLVAALSRRARRLDGGTATESSEAYLAGTLHEIGALALSGLSAFDPVELGAVLVDSDVTNERLVLGADRFAVGGYLLGLWGFPRSIITSIAALAENPEPDGVPLCWALRVAREAVVSGQAQLRTSDADDSEMDELLTKVAVELRNVGHATRHAVQT